MTEQVVTERIMTVDGVEKTDMNMTTQAANSDPYAVKVPAETVLFNEAPVVGADVAVRPVDGTIVHEDVVSNTVTHENTPIKNVGSLAALLNREESEQFRTRWNEIQSKFIDDPRSAVQEADTLVSKVIEQITLMFTNEHSSLEAQWGQGKDVSTEDLRKALQHYRSFFNRLVV